MKLSAGFAVVRNVAVTATKAAGNSTPSPPRAFASRAALVFAFLWSLFSARAAKAFLAWARRSQRGFLSPCHGAYACAARALPVSNDAGQIITSMLTEL